MTNQQKPTLTDLFNALRKLTFDYLKIYTDPYNLFHVRYNRDMPLDSDDALKVYIAQKEGIKKDEITLKKIKEVVKKIEENQKARDEFQKRLDDIRLHWDSLAQKIFPAPLDLGGGWRPELANVLFLHQFISMVESKCNGKFAPFHVFRDALAEELIRQEEKYLQKWGEKIEELSPDGAEKIKEAKIISFPTPQGAKWSDVYITFIDSENVRIKVKDIEKKVNYIEMGFGDRRSYGKPKGSWILLKMFALKNGKLEGYKDTMKDKVKTDIHGLKDDLRTYFKIEGNPIPHNKGYKTAFTIQGNPPITEREVESYLKAYSPDPYSHEYPNEIISQMSCRDED